MNRGATVKKLNRLSEVRIEIEPKHVPFYINTDEERAKYYEEWARELTEFIRDHRSQDGAYINVIRKHEDFCSGCGHVWETMEDDGKLYCSWCGEEQEAANGKSE